MTEEKNIYHPFILSAYKDSYSLLLTNLRWDLFEEKNYLGNGYDWTRIVRKMINEKSIELMEDIEFDSEADMFCVMSKKLHSLVKIVDMVVEFFDDDEKLRKVIDEYADYE